MVECLDHEAQKTTTLYYSPIEDDPEEQRMVIFNHDEPEGDVMTLLSHQEATREIVFSE